MYVFNFKSVPILIFNTFFNNKNFSKAVVSTYAIANSTWLGIILRDTLLRLRLDLFNEMTFSLILLFNGRRDSLFWVPLWDGTVLTLGDWEILVLRALICIGRLFLVSCCTGSLRSILQGGGSTVGSVFVRFSVTGLPAQSGFRGSTLL